MQGWGGAGPQKKQGLNLRILHPSSRAASDATRPVLGHDGASAKARQNRAQVILLQARPRGIVSPHSRRWCGGASRLGGATCPPTWPKGSPTPPRCALAGGSSQRGPRCETGGGGAKGTKPPCASAKAGSMAPLLHSLLVCFWWQRRFDWGAASCGARGEHRAMVRPMRPARCMPGYVAVLPGLGACALLSIAATCSTSSNR